MNLWKPILAALLIFTAGVMTGGLLVSYADRVSQKVHRATTREATRETTRQSANANAPLPPTTRDPSGRPLPYRAPRAISEDFMRKLDAEISLTSGQRERIEAVIADGQTRNKEIWDRITPELRREIADTQKRIREILTPEQRVTFEELMKQNRPANRRTTEEALPANARPRRSPTPENP